MQAYIVCSQACDRKISTDKYYIYAKMFFKIF